VRLRNTGIVYLVVIVLLLGAVALAEDQGREFQWKGKIPADKLLAIKNVNGDIDAVSADSDEVQVTAEKSGRNAEQIRIEVVPSSEGVAICAMYPGSSGKCGIEQNSYSTNLHGENGKVHFSVHMPKNVRFAADDVNGNVKAENMGRAVRASSVNGNVSVSTASWAEAETVNGSIKASMGDSGWDGTLKIESVNGSIELDMPGDLNTDVSFSSVNGHIDSDFPLTINNHWPVGHSAKGVIGKGGRELAIKTVNGNVDLRKGSGSI
jgi:Putative adhesin